MTLSSSHPWNFSGCSCGRQHMPQCAGHKIKACNGLESVARFAVSSVCLSIVAGFDFKEALFVDAHRAYLRSILAYDDMSAIAAYPHGVTVS